MVTQEQSKIALNALIKRYNENKQDKDFCKNESQISNSLIKPFVNLVLGYDTAEPSEFKVESSMGGKRSDMLVCLNGVTQFVIEAKSIIHEIRKDYHDYRQAIQYASYKEKKFAILTNFKYFIILDAEIETEPLKAEVASIDIENLKEQDFDILWSFSKEIWKEQGEGNEILLKLKGKKKQKIDEQLLDDLKKWRESLHNSLKKHPLKNKYDFHEDSGKIEEEIQKFIDRLVFICYCEDKQLMDVELNPVISDKDKYWEKEWYVLERIRKLFEIYQKKYNSDLFNESWCDKFYFDDHTLLNVLKDLRQPKEKQPYDFSVIEADILGKTYENFIGHVLTGEKRFKEKESKGKRKSEGIYYTPVYIVDYIVRNTVKEYIKGKSIASINKVKILDPACGSGSFLIKAFDVLVEECEKIRRLTYEEKRDLMLSCIFGVDKDERAVEICKLNLSLKLAERGQKLPELHDNIKCGDSLIDDKEIVGDKAFNWNEKFKSIMDNGGFDVVIGNPPYVEHKKLKQFSEYFKQNYEIYSGTADLYVYFYEKSLKILKEHGLLGFITSNKFMKTTYGSKLRLLLTKKTINEIIDFTDVQVFEALVASSVVIIRNDLPVENYIHITLVDDSLKKIGDLPYYINKKRKLFSQNTLDESIWKIVENRVLDLKNKIDKIGSKIKDLDGIKIFRGVTTGFNPAFIIDEKTKNYFYKNTKDADTIIKPILQGRNIKRYYYNWDKKWLLFIPWHFPLHEDISISGASKKSEEKFKNHYPLIYKHLLKFRKELYNRNKEETGIRYEWYSLQRCAATYYKKFEEEKIIWGLTADKWAFAYDDKKHYLPSNGYILTSEKIPLKLILAQLNSNLIKFYFGLIGVMTAGGAYTLKHETIAELPICLEKESEDKISNLADKMLSLNKKLQEIGDKSTIEKEKIQKEIQKTDNEIDELVYRLYGITEEEKKIIEESLK